MYIICWYCLFLSAASGAYVLVYSDIELATMQDNKIHYWLLI